MSRKRLNIKIPKLEMPANKSEVFVKKAAVVARTEGQKTYIKSIIDNDIVFCQGPAGTGKTHIAVGMAVKSFTAGKVDKIIVARPVVEAGERIGFLPGDQDKKLDPYIRPIMDELSYYMSYSDIIMMRNNRQLEVVPIGYMRGRTFKNAFIIVDECQNATHDQIKMILTRLGDSSKMVLNGDFNQSDLNIRDQGGFRFAYELFNGVEGIACTQLTGEDIQRHYLVKKMLALWDGKLVDKG